MLEINKPPGGLNRGFTVSSSGSVKSARYIPRYFASRYIARLFTSPSGDSCTIVLKYEYFSLVCSIAKELFSLYWGQLLIPKKDNGLGTGGNRN